MNILKKISHDLGGKMDVNKDDLKNIEVKIGNLSVLIKHGDLTRESVDAICNPANSLMFMGGGVAGALKRVGGEEIEREALKYAPVPVGEAVATTAGKLSAKWVIHSPTMERPAMSTTPTKVYLATKAALDRAERAGARSIAMPGMGTGIGGVSPESAAEAMFKAISDFSRSSKSLGKVVLCDRKEEMIRAWKKVAKSGGK